MTVTANPRDSEGARLAAAVTTLSAQVTATTSTQHKASLAAALDQAQRELVLHYMMVGRLTAANILSTMS